MRNIFYLFFLVTNLVYSQMPPEVMQDLNNFEPGELIVKLKDNVDAGVYYQENGKAKSDFNICLLYTSPSPRDYAASRMPSSA